jgi:alpha-D-xyloside xylohydrolase
MPWYVRAGSSIPLGPNVEYANQFTTALLALRIIQVPRTKSRSTRVRTTTAITKKQLNNLPIQLERKLRQLTISDHSGMFPGMQVSRLFNMVLVKPYSGVNVA